MLFMVALLTMVSLVVRFMLVLGTLLVLQFGTVVLLYHCTHYTFRGTTSDIGTLSGAFIVAINLTASFAGWGTGAALSFKLDIII